MSVESGHKRNDSGSITERVFETHALRAGWHVWKPLHSSRHDYMVDKGLGVKLYQVKTGSRSSTGRVSCPLRTGLKKSLTPYQDGDFDVLAIVIGDEVLEFPWDAEFMSGESFSYGGR